jgi:cytochrome c553
MRTALTILLLLACVSLTPAPSYQAPTAAPTYKNVGNMSQLMVDIIYPASDAIFYIERAPPKNEVEWKAFRAQALMLAESGNLLLMPGRSRDNGKWAEDTKLMIDAGQAAYKAALAKNVEAIVALNDQLTAACITCHKDYRPNYGKGAPLAK